MAKGNMLLGYARGSVGDVTFSRVGGQQVQRARNRKPANPRTEGQTLQRARFAAAVKFAQQVRGQVGNFWRFAYEDIRPNESDYNAYMRHNIQNAGLIGYEANGLANWPALGTWLVTSGSLPTIPAEIIDGGIIFRTTGSSAAIQTTSSLAEFSRGLIAADGTWRNGDILTILAYAADTYAAPTTDVSSYGGNLQVICQQYIIDTESTQALSLGLAFEGGRLTPLDVIFSRTDGSVQLAYPQGSVQNGTMIWGGAVIHSRNASSGLLVSTQNIAWDRYSGERVAQSFAITDPAYTSAVMSSWRAADKALLQGAGATTAMAMIKLTLYIDGGTEREIAAIPFGTNGRLGGSYTPASGSSAFQGAIFFDNGEEPDRLSYTVTINGPSGTKTESSTGNPGLIGINLDGWTGAISSISVTATINGQTLTSVFS